MIELFLVYKWSVACGIAMAVALALLGAHLAARDRALQSLALSQGASFGVLLGIALVGMEAEGALAKAMPFASGVVGAFAVFLASERSVASRRAGKGTVFVSLFIALLAASYWTISCFPQLESHLAQAFFGDLVTISGLELWFTFAAALAGIAWLLLDRRAQIRDSFDIAILGEENLLERRAFRRFQVGTLLLLSAAIFSLGMLFTVAMLFIGTTLLRAGRGGVRAHFWRITLASALGTALGFLASLRWDRLPTVPTIVLCLVFLGLMPRLFGIFGRRRGS